MSGIGLNRGADSREPGEQLQSGNDRGLRQLFQTDDERSVREC